MSKKVLVVDDEKTIVKGIKFSLEQDDFVVDCAYDGEEAVDMAKHHKYDIILLDLMLPVMSGLDACQQIREFSNVPIIMLTAKGDDMDKILGLENGADDYITKPFSLAILRARVNAQLRRAQKRVSSVYQSDPFLFDFDHMVFQKSGLQIELSKTEQKLLRILLDNRGMTVSRAVLVDRIWSDGAEYVDENALSVAMKRLRDKLEDDPSQPTYLKTIYGLGYTWAVK